MSQIISFRADAKYGYHGKEYIARITGRDSKFTFGREFVGRKNRGSTEYTTDVAGLYVECDIDSKGRKDETYYVAYLDPQHGMQRYVLSLEQAMGLASRLAAEGDLDWYRAALQTRLEDNLAAGSTDQQVTAKLPVGRVAAGTKITRQELTEELRSILQPPAVDPLPAARNAAQEAATALQAALETLRAAAEATGRQSAVEAAADAQSHLRSLLPCIADCTDSE